MLNYTFIQKMELSTNNKLRNVILTLTLAILSTVTISCNDDDGIKPVNKEIVKSTHLEAVDLGLSVDWASCNIGAMAPSEFGGHYCWGDPTGLEKGYLMEDMPSNICGTKNDIVTANFGQEWRLPTNSEIQELISKCTYKKVTLDGTSGYKLTGPSGNSIFLPCAGYIYGNTVYIMGENSCGYYWSGEATPSKMFAKYLYIGNVKLPDYGNASYSVSVRAVKIKKDSGNSSEDNDKDDDSGSGSGGSSSSYEAPEVYYDDFTPGYTNMKVQFRIGNKNRTKVTSAKGHCGSKTASGNIGSAIITFNFSNLRRGTKYKVYCTVSGPGGNGTSDTVTLSTLN